MDFADSGKKSTQASERDPYVENKKELDNVMKRLVELERNQELMERNLDGEDLEIANNLEEFKLALVGQQKEIEHMKADLKEFIRTVMLFVKELQDTATTDDLEKLNSAAEYWAPETWVSRNELAKMTERILEENEK